MPYNNSEELKAPFEGASKAPEVGGSMKDIRDDQFDKEMRNAAKGRAAGMEHPEVMASLHAVIG